MALKIKLKPNEKVVVNGALLENGPRKTSFKVLNFTNIIRESDLITRDQATRPVGAIYYAIQSLLTNPSIAEDSSKQVQATLAKLYVLLEEEADKSLIMEAANFISSFNFYKALQCIKPLLQREDELFPEVADSA